jgi:hypothetical protein
MTKRQNKKALFLGIITAAALAAGLTGCPTGEGDEDPKPKAEGKHWLVGAITDNWSPSAALPMTKDATGGTYSWSGSIPTGKGGLKLVENETAPASWDEGNWFAPDADADVPLTVAIGTPQTVDARYFEGKSGESKSWNLQTAGDYTITLNPTTKKVTFNRTAEYVPPSNLKYWVIGEVNSWSLDTAILMTKNTATGTHSWSGTISGELKFIENETAPTWDVSIGGGEGKEFSAVRGTPVSVPFGGDNFKLLTTGTYTIVLNPTAQTVTFTLN